MYIYMYIFICVYHTHIPYAKHNLERFAGKVPKVPVILLIYIIDLS